MKKMWYSETQIIKILNEIEGGRQIKEVCREYGISDATYHNWKPKYDGMKALDVKKLKELEAENQRLKRTFADLILKYEALKDTVEKNAWSAPVLQGKSLVTNCSSHKCIRPLMSQALLAPRP